MMSKGKRHICLSPKVHIKGAVMFRTILFWVLWILWYLGCTKTSIPCGSPIGCTSDHGLKRSFLTWSQPRNIERVSIIRIENKWRPTWRSSTLKCNQIQLWSCWMHPYLTKWVVHCTMDGPLRSLWPPSSRYDGHNLFCSTTFFSTYWTTIRHCSSLNLAFFVNAVSF